MSWLDSLYFQGKILKILSNKEDFDKFVRRKNVSKNYLRGYLYLIEVTINSFINCIEFLIRDENVYDVIHYQNIGLKNIPKKYRDSSKELISIKKLEDVRDNLSNIRKKDLGGLNPELKKLSSLIKEIFDYFLSKKRTKINSENKKNESLYLIVELTNKQNHMEADFDLFNKKDELIPTYPACNYYNLGYSKIHSEYHFQNPIIKNYEREYIQGYVFGLAFVYSSIKIVPEDLIGKLVDCQSWMEIHKIGSKIYDRLIRNKKIDFIGQPVYEELKFLSISWLNKSKIDYNDLRFLFRERKIFLIEPKEKGHPTETVPFFISLVSGRKNFDDSQEIIELKVKKSNEEFWYSYAVFIPYGGALWNGSYWVLFKDIAFERGKDYKTDGRRLIEPYLDNDGFIVHKHEVSQRILDKYLSEFNPEYQKNKRLNIMLKDSNSLLVELMYLYYTLKHKKEKITDLEWGIDIIDNNKKTIITEADLILYTDKQAIIVQAQTNLYKNIKELISHFDNVEKFLKKDRKNKIKNKEIKKEVFVFFNDEFKDSSEIKKLENKSINTVFFEDFLSKNPNFLNDNVKIKLSNCLQKVFK